MAVTNLGQISAFFKGTSAPTNTDLIWQDTSVNPNVFKAYDSGLASWVQLGKVTSVAVSGSDGLEVDSGSPITTSGTIALGIDAGALRTHISVEENADVTDETNVKAALDGATITNKATPVSGDKVLIQDSEDSDSLKEVNFGDFGNQSGIIKTRVSVSSAEILALNTTPKELIPAQGAGTIIVVHNILIKYNYATAAYATNTTLRFRFGTSSALDAPNIISEVLDKVRATSLVGPALGDYTVYENDNFNVTVVTGDPTGSATGTLDIDIFYSVSTI